MTPAQSNNFQRGQFGQVFIIYSETTKNDHPWANHYTKNRTTEAVFSGTRVNIVVKVDEFSEKKSDTPSTVPIDKYKTISPNSQLIDSYYSYIKSRKTFVGN